MLKQPHLRAFLYALQFLTRIPVPLSSAPDTDDQSRAALYYPVIGLLIGLLLASIVYLFNAHEPVLLSAILVVIWAAITGGLHLDGLADSADAWLGGFGSLDKTHAILKDPLLGTAGVVAIFCILLIKYSALYSLIKQQHYMIIALAPLIGRSLILLLFITTDYVRKQGLAAAVVDGLNSRVALIGLIPVVLIAAWFSIAGIIATLIVFIALRRLMIKRLGGCTGDTAGANVEIGEAIWLCAAALS